jgi:hypothetical protein
MMSGRSDAMLTANFIDKGSGTVLELTNEGDETLSCVEILTVFLKDEQTPGGGPSQAHIRFEALKAIQPKEKAVLSHRTWINGKPAVPEEDQLRRLTAVSGELRPYVLDLSWQNPDGKMCYQRIPVGH